MRGQRRFFSPRTVRWIGWSFERHTIASRTQCRLFCSLHPQDVVRTVLSSFQTRLALTRRTLQKRPSHHVLCKRSNSSFPLLLFPSSRDSRPCSGKRRVRGGRLVPPTLGSNPTYDLFFFSLRVPRGLFRSRTRSSRFQAFSLLPSRVRTSPATRVVRLVRVHVLRPRRKWSTARVKMSFVSFFLSDFPLDPVGIRDRPERFPNRLPVPKEREPDVGSRRKGDPTRSWSILHLWPQNERETHQVRGATGAVVFGVGPTGSGPTLAGRMHPGADALVSTAVNRTTGDGRQEG